MFFTVPKLLYQASLVTQTSESTDFGRYSHTFRFTVFWNQPSRISKPSTWFQSLGSTTLLWLSQNETNLIPCSTDSNFVSGWVTIIWKRSCMSRFQWSVVKFKDIIWKMKISTEKLKAVLFKLWVTFGQPIAAADKNTQFNPIHSYLRSFYIFSWSRSVWLLQRWHTEPNIYQWQNMKKRSCTLHYYVVVHIDGFLCMRYQTGQVESCKG